MNIQEAKTEIARTYRAYMKKDEKGDHRIAVEKQRPVLLIGPPGIGKTAIMKQIAEEEGCGLVAYSMTHHTRQSAIGLPYISEKEYGGRKWSVTEYTMSEIVASIYEYMNKTGKKSGILFLDEINCVSETLQPVILQLLQNKRFGNIDLPEDWIIVAAGNPPEYNRSVREMDMVTLDRVKNIDVEADLKVWQRYAVKNGIHMAVRSYLDIYPDHFYRITDTDSGQFFVTARGWEDLSLMLTSYEEDGIEVDEKWFLQYLQHDEIAHSFGLYYKLFRCFYERFEKEGEGSMSLASMLLSSPDRLEALSSTECITVASMLSHTIEVKAGSISEKKKRLEKFEDFLSHMPPDSSFSDDESIRAYFSEKRKSIEKKREQITRDPLDEIREKDALDCLEDCFAKWRMQPYEERGSVSDIAKEKIEEESERIRVAAKEAAGDAEEGFKILRCCPQGKSAVLYFLHDLSVFDEESGILKLGGLVSLGDEED